MKKIVFIHNFTPNNSNRGCQALTYGMLAFLLQKYQLKNYKVIAPAFCYKPRKSKTYSLNINGEDVVVLQKYYNVVDIFISLFLCKLFGRLFRITPFSRDLSRIEYVANICAGDGFTDMYSNSSFRFLTWPSYVACFLNKRSIILPQTVGPFESRKCRSRAHYILKKSEIVYVRDLEYREVFEREKISYSLEKDVSYYMNPQKIDYPVIPNSIGINISGLAYFNNYGKLADQFPCYGELIVGIIKFFVEKKIDVYLVPHTYNYSIPSNVDDDLEAAKYLYNSLEDKSLVHVVNLDMNAAEAKYIISQFDFFIGTRMHANFAAIYTQTPVFGLAYSYKFSGAFDQNGLNGQYASVIMLDEVKIAGIIQKVADIYSIIRR